MADKPEKPRDIVRRGEYGTDIAGAAVFCGLRGLDPLLQRWILETSPLDALFSKPTSTPGTHPNIIGAHPSHPVPRHTTTTTVSSPNGTALFSFPNLSLSTVSLSEPSTILWSMSILSAAKHIYTILYITNEPMSAPTATMVAVFNTVMNSINTLLFTIRASNPTYTDPSSLYVGAALFAIGIIAEPLAETQRKMFKDAQAKSSTADKAKKPYTGGLFGLARNVNYGAYTVWRTGYALAGGGWVWGLIMGAFFTAQFARDAVPMLEDYMRKRYGEEEWAQVEKKVPYRLFPGIY